jgi:hypothetical protein
MREIDLQLVVKNVGNRVPKSICSCSLFSNFFDKVEALFNIPHCQQPPKSKTDITKSSPAKAKGSKQHV